jgi:hypothetical protein
MPTKTPKKAARTKAVRAARPGKNTKLKTKETGASVEAFIASVANETRRADARTLLAMMKRVTGEKPKMWGPSIVGFGRYRYRYESGHEGEMCMAGFSPRASSLVVYVMPGFSKYEPLLAKLGKHKRGESCLYVNKLADIDLPTLQEIIAVGVAEMRRRYAS